MAGRIVLGARVVGLAGEKGRHALAVEDAQFDGASRDGFNAASVEPAIRAQNPQAGAEPLLGMLSAGEHGADQAFGVRPNLAGPAAETIRRPFGVAPVGAGHVIGLRAMLAAHVAALVDRDALTAMEHLDDSLGDTDLDFGANEGMRNRIEELVDLDVIVEVDPCASPFGKLPILGRQAIEGGAFDLLEQLAPAQPEFAHRALVHTLHDEFDGLVAFSQREERQRTQSSQNIGLSKSDSGLDFRFISRLVRSRREEFQPNNAPPSRHRFG